VFGVNNGVEFGKHSVRMRAGWYPYEVNGRTQAVSLVRGGPLAFMSPPGYVHVHFMDHPNEEFIKAIKENSSAYGKYGWGTALVLNKSFYTNVLKITPNTSKTTVFVPELNAMIDVLNIADLDDIRTLASRE
jgi:hypothetical protein